MKKHGFTLVEVVIAIGVIGVVAAIAAPLLSNLIPDKDKITVLKTYKIICDINADIRQDTDVWQESPDIWQANPGGDQRLKWTDVLAPGREYSNLVFNQLNTVENSRVVSVRGIQFDTVDGNRWFVENPDDHSSIITIDLMNERKEHCTYNQNNCTKPGRFAFHIDAGNLNIKPGDPLTAAYLDNPTKLNDKKADYKTAKNDNNNYTR